MLSIWAFLWYWFKETVWKGVETFKSGKESVAHAVALISVVVGFCGYFSGRLPGFQFKPSKEISEGLEMIGFGVGAILLVRRFLMVPHELYKSAWNKSEKMEASLKEELEIRRSECEKIKAELTDLRNEHQPLKLNGFVKTYGDYSGVMVYIEVHNPSQITAAKNVILEFLDIAAALPDIGAESSFNRVLRKSETAFTINPEASSQIPLMSIKSFAADLVMGVEVVMNDRGTSAASLIAKKDGDGTPVIPLIFQPFHFLVGVTALERPRAVQTFTMKVGKTGDRFQVDIAKSD